MRGKFKSENRRCSFPIFCTRKLSFHLLKKELEFRLYFQQFNVNLGYIKERSTSKTNLKQRDTFIVKLNMCHDRVTHQQTEFALIIVIEVMTLSPLVVERFLAKILGKER